MKKKKRPIAYKIATCQLCDLRTKIPAARDVCLSCIHKHGQNLDFVLAEKLGLAQLPGMKV
jgi:hypothetical protein